MIRNRFLGVKVLNERPDPHLPGIYRLLRTRADKWTSKMIVSLDDTADR